MGHTILRMVSHLLNDPTGVDDDRGTHDRAKRDRQTRERDVVRRLQRLGNGIVLHPVGVTSWRPFLCFSEHPGQRMSSERFESCVRPSQTTACEG